MTTTRLERRRLREFAAAIGERDPVYVDVARARAVGHPDLPVPLTFLFTLESEGQGTLDFMHDLGVDPAAVLHGEQEFSYARPLHAGQEVSLSTAVVADRLHAEKGLRILTRETQISHEGQVACVLRSTWVIRLSTHS